MSQLTTLRSRLNTLRQRRLVVRWGNAWSALITGLLWTLAAMFLVDYSLEMSRLQRVVSWLCFAGASWWIFRCFTKPFLGRRETELDMALLVEKQQEIDTDLVAALQFESPQSKEWGSSTLKQAVIDYVADFGQGVDVFQGFNTAQLRRRLMMLVTSLLLVGTAAGMFPRHVATFFNRLLLGSRHYPTRTVIEEIVINGRDVNLDDPSGILKFPFGQLLKLEVSGRGDLPPQGRVTLTSLAQGIQTELKLLPQGERKSDRATYIAEQPRLVDSIRCQFYLGDAWTDPLVLQVIPLPVVTLDLKAIPPEYAAQVERTLAEKSGSRQIAVIEGSHVELKLGCSNKPLKSATVTVDRQTISLVSVDAQRKIWSLPQTPTPFSRITTPLSYQVQVQDQDGLGLERPIEGFVRMKSDRPPRVFAGVISKRVLPEARPQISFGASDDYGIAKVRLLQEISRASGTIENHTADIATSSLSQRPQTTYKGQYAADLKPLNLVKGDRLKLTLEATDYRGQQEGATATSEPLVLEVTDVQGFLAGMAEADEQSAQRLDAIIQRQLGIGETN